jgi:D-alanine transaminase
MPRIAYVNGRYVAHREAAVHVEDRGLQFADAVYEVCEVRGGRLIDEHRHMARLDRSLGELRIRPPMTSAALGVVLREVVRRNRVIEGIVYLQVTRGVAPRDHGFPAAAVRPGVIVTARAMPLAPRDARAKRGVSVITVADNRWQRVDIKTTGLLPNVLAKEKARAASAFEAWFVDEDGYVTEGTSTNAWIVTTDGAVVTAPTDRGILSGITRAVLLDVLRRRDLRLEERRFALAEARGAREAFLTSATTAVTPIVRIDGRAVADGRPGRVASELRQALREAAEVAPAWSGPRNPGRSDI